MTDSGAEELREVKGLIADPDFTLVIASHGLEWWAGFLLNTPVRAGSPGLLFTNGKVRTELLPADAFTRYSRVLLLPRSAATRPEAPTIASPLAPAVQRIHAGRFFEVFELPPPSGI